MCMYAFDMVDHAILVGKLLSLQVPGFIIHWIISFLTDRTQATKLGLSLSTLLFINRSIVQGSGIGPTLFIMFAHNLKPLDMSNYLLKYDDDATLLSPQNSPTPVQGLTSQVIYYRPHSQTLIECAMQSCSESTLDMILISPSMSSPLLLFVTKYFTCLHNLKNRALVYVP